MSIGVPHGRDVDYLLGYPFYNSSLGNITGIVPEQTDWTYVDRNVSDFMQDMWLNFTKYGSGQIYMLDHNKGVGGK